ncbi:hypothetical protein SAMN06265350_104322 [Solitalea koreensis]|uniref:Uncharacterized protein n=1 Tax=Solitalea koreensis TaxID=543615 RepID=A0A521CSB9_9SPHI|nr:hypothetical protein SAMN06265350_104322 [Solitalea koreensis]
MNIRPVSFSIIGLKMLIKKLFSKKEKTAFLIVKTRFYDKIELIYSF